MRPEVADLVGMIVEFTGADAHGVVGHHTRLDGSEQGLAMHVLGQAIGQLVASDTPTDFTESTTVEILSEVGEIDHEMLLCDLGPVAPEMVKDGLAVNHCWQGNPWECGPLGHDHVDGEGATIDFRFHGMSVDLRDEVPENQGIVHPIHRR